MFLSTNLEFSPPSCGILFAKEDCVRQCGEEEEEELAVRRRSRGVGATSGARLQLLQCCYGGCCYGAGRWQAVAVLGLVLRYVCLQNSGQKVVLWCVCVCPTPSPPSPWGHTPDYRVGEV